MKITPPKVDIKAAWKSLEMKARFLCYADLTKWNLETALNLTKLDNKKVLLNEAKKQRDILNQLIKYCEEDNEN